MKRTTVEELARAPVGKYVAGDNFAHFCAAPGLWGVILWGRPGAADAFELGRSLILELGPPAAPHASIFDASRLTHSEPDAFRAAERYLASFSAALSSYVHRLALVRAAGINGAVIAGAFEVLPQPFPVRVCDDADSALAWLGEARAPDEVWPDDPAALMTAIYDQVIGEPRALAKLRVYLDEHLDELRLDEVARSLGVSPRTLQRQLGEAKTTFTDEVTSARMRAARRLLLESEASLTEIAMEVGCKTLQHFSAMFRRRAGESPSAFRARHKSR